MNKREYRIYVVKQHFDAGVDSEVKRWALRGRFSCRHKALHKARVLSLLDQYSLVDVHEWVSQSGQGLSKRKILKSKSKPRRSSRVIWSHEYQDSHFMTRLHLKASAIRRQLSKWRCQ
tara:strand:+ start:118791 stop:119144 length:354 start_codon:yes stop_codon:yes gene_type:complete